MEKIVNKKRIIALWLFTANIIILSMVASLNGFTNGQRFLWVIGGIALGISCYGFVVFIKVSALKKEYEASQYAFMSGKSFEAVYRQKKSQLDYGFVSSVLKKRVNRCEILSHQRFVNLDAIDHVIEIDHIVIDASGCYLIKTVDSLQLKTMHWMKLEALLKEEMRVIKAHTRINFKAFIIAENPWENTKLVLTPKAFINRLRFTIPIYTESDVQALYDHIEQATLLKQHH